MPTAPSSIITDARDWDLGRARRDAELAELREKAAKAALRAQIIETQGRALGLSGDFDSARRTRVRPGARPRGGSADSHRTPRTLDAIRRDVQSLLRNDKLARSLVKRTCDLVVGDGVSLQVKSTDSNFNTAVEKWLCDWWDEGGTETVPAIEHNAHRRADGRWAGRTGTQLCRLAVRSAFRDGGVLAVLTAAGQVQLVEYERLKNPKGKDNDPAFVNGVQFASGGDGPATAYHVAGWDKTSGRAYPEIKTQAVGAEYVLNLANPVDDEVNVTIPEPGLSALVEDFSTIRNYIKDTQVASRIATLFGLVSKTQYPADFGLQLPGVSVTKTQQDGSTKSLNEAEIEPGFMAHLKPGEDLVQVKPEQPTTVFGDFVMTNLVLMGAEVGLPLVLWMLDLSKTNFASARCAVLLAWATVSVWRRWLRDRFIVPLVRWRVAMAIRAGEIPGVTTVPEGWDRFEVLFPPMPVLEPQMQYQAEAYAVEKGLKTHRDVWRLFNRGDYDEGLEQMAEERERRAELGILPVLTPGQLDPHQGRGKPPTPTTDAPAPPTSPEPTDSDAADGEDA